MKHLKFQIIIVTILLAATRTIAFDVGDYVDYSDPKADYKEFGTVIAVAESNELTIRPHGTMQGDFKILPRGVILVKNAKVLKSAQPKAGEYTINLMWVNKNLSTGDYVFPKDSLNEKLAQVAAWAKANSPEKVNVWYDSAMSSPDVVAKTMDLLTKNYPNEVRQIVFLDLRQFPEVTNHPKVFSDKTPVYFRVDLLRVVAAYNFLKGKANHRHHFVYADIDVTPMTKDELFNSATQMDLDQFAIVMAHGGLNPYKFENSFQIWSNNKPNLLTAAKAAIIDTNIARAKNILSGEYWAYKKPFDTGPLEQVVYDSYSNMFHYFYHLEGWGSQKNLLDDKSVQENPDKYFGLISIEHLPLDITNPNLMSVSKKFWSDGITFSMPILYIPRKIISAPPSQFGGQPTKFNPDEINPKNFEQKLEKMLVEHSPNGQILLIAVVNKNTGAVSKIAHELSADELASVALTPLDSGYQAYMSIPLLAAFDKENPEAVKIIVDKIKNDQALLEKAAEAVIKYDFLKNIAKYPASSIETIFQAFSPHINLLEMMVDGLSKDYGYNGTPLHGAIAKDRDDIIEIIYNKYASNQKLLQQLSDSLLNSKTGMRNILQANSKTIAILRKTFFSDPKRLSQALLRKSDNDVKSSINQAIDDKKIDWINELASDLLGDPDFISQWAPTLVDVDRFGANVLHSAARDSSGNSIKFLSKLFAPKYSEILKKALEAKSSNGETPVDLAEKNNEAKLAITDLIELVNKQ